MVRYRNHEGRGCGRSFDFENRFCRVFLAPDTGANGGGGTTSTQTGAAGGGAGGTNSNVTSQQQQQQQASPWDTINWDELDEATRTTLRAAQADHQRVARENATLAEQAEANRQRVASLQQQQQQPQPNGNQQQQPQVDPVEANIRATLKAQGYNQQQIDAQAPALAKVMANLLPLFKASVGQDLAPLATTVIAQQNQNNFEAAMQTPAGQQLFADPELAQHVWTVVGQQTIAGKTFDPDAILNFAKMAYFDKQQAANQPAPSPTLQPTSSSFFPTVQQQPPVSRSTGFSFPGASTLMRPLVTNNGNGTQSHAVNADTQAALATTFSEMARITGGAPKAFPSNLAHAGGGAQKK